ncbi:MAG: nicotinate-nucleotide diphosphorylase (carboxylating) [Nitrospirae bacterium GWC2_57_13]|nr:MAG: nicotinate-nucleotide diphosphorylase (carboxylating) [Nitrospirae bacterium GWC2_57_13]
MLQVLAEDIGSGDVTSEAIVPSDAVAIAEIKAKEGLVLAGIDIVREVFHSLDPAIKYEPLAKEGDTIKAGAVLARVSGKTRVLLAGERVALNILQHLSGIATLTAQYVERIQGTKAQILDTRKTLPGLRALEKHAVRIGGGRNHRFGLYDGILIKDNHITAAGGITGAVELARNKAHHLLKIEVETKTLDEVKEALEARADVIMLDNMPLDMMRQAVRIISGRAFAEASGNVSLARVRQIAETGVDLISAGALTHSAPAADISMKII